MTYKSPGLPVPDNKIVSFGHKGDENSTSKRCQATMVGPGQTATPVLGMKSVANSNELTSRFGFGTLHHRTSEPQMYELCTRLSQKSFKSINIDQNIIYFK